MQVKKHQLEMDMEQQTGSKLGKKVVYYQGCVLSPCLFNLYAKYIMRNARLNEAQDGMKAAGRNINNLRYSDDTTLTAESEEELRSLLMKVKEEKDHGVQSNHFMSNRWGNNGKSENFIFWGSQITADSDCSHKIKRCLLLGRKARST